MATVEWAGFWGDADGAYSLLVDKMPRLDSMRRVVLKPGFRVSRALLGGLIGAASGSNVTATHSEISTGPTTPAGGVLNPGQEPVASVTDINRNTTAADVTALKEFLVNVRPAPSPYVRDLSGNGGPALSY